MVTLQISDLSLSFGEREILKDVRLTLDSNTRAALAGANGSGKSTLLKVITGLLPADSMTISKTKGALISYLPQSDIVLPDKSVYEVADEGYERFKVKEAEMESLSASLGTAKEGDNYYHALSRIEEIRGELEEAGYYHRSSRICTILSGLGFREKDFNRRCNEFSGGWQMRIALSRILTENPDMLLLDEPTNYLDIEARIWLRSYLFSFHGGVLLVSHDQDFLDESVDCVYELFRGHLTRYSGNYTKYLEKRQEEIAQLEKAYKAQQEEIEKTGQFIERFRYKATKSKQVQSRIKALEKTTLIEIPEHLRKLSFTFPPSAHSGNDVLIVEHLHKAFGENVIYKDLSFLVRKKEFLAVTGRNGAGKSTLLRLIADQDEDYNGTIRYGSGVRVGYFAQDNEAQLDGDLTVLEEAELGADTKDLPSMRSLLGAFLFEGDDVFKKVSVLSGGEKSRLSLLKILLHPANLLILDEPTNHLDINAKEMLLKALKEYDGTLIFVSHDTWFIRNLAKRILYLGDEGPEFFDGDYEYFQSKLEEKEAKFQIGNPKENKAAAQNAERNEHKEQKALRNRKRKLEKEAEELLERSEELRDKIAAIEEEISKPEVYSVATRITKLLKEKEVYEAEADSLDELWLEKQEEIETIGGLS